MFKFESPTKQQNKQEVPKSLSAHTISPDADPSGKKILYCLEQLPSTPAYLPQDFKAEMQQNGIARGAVKVFQDHGLEAWRQRAYARGNEIHVASNISLNSIEGRHILRHELAHVIQQGNNLLNSGSETDWEHQADALHTILDKRNTVPSGTVGYPAQGIDKFNIEMPLPEEYQKLNDLMKDFDQIDYSDDTATPQTRETMFRLLHNIDLEVYRMLNLGMDVQSRIFLKEIPEYEVLQKILKISDKNYTELVGKIINTPGYDGTEFPVALDDADDADEIRIIWQRLFSKDSKIKVQTERLSDEFRTKIYSFMGKMLHYDTGAQLLITALSGPHNIQIEPSDKGPQSIVKSDETRDFSFKELKNVSVDEKNQYGNTKAFKDDFFELLRRMAVGTNYFSVDGQEYAKGAGNNVLLKMPLKHDSFDTGTGNKQAQSAPWLIFAHELGHAVKFSYGMHFSNHSLYPDKEVKDYYEDGLSTEEYANNCLVENPLRKESGMRKRIKYEGLGRIMARNFRRQLLSGELANSFKALEIFSNMAVDENNERKKIFSILNNSKLVQEEIMKNPYVIDEWRNYLKALPPTNKCTLI
ncbi:MAG: DUF4157 domain-containing protein [Lachnospiraceae bacterium]|nr:DUF4157 domain-containing protein [Lachnospiraceae bacterium]